VSDEDRPKPPVFNRDTLVSKYREIQAERKRHETTLQEAMMNVHRCAGAEAILAHLLELTQNGYTEN
jgi:hypothetical protein